MKIIKKKKRIAILIFPDNEFYVNWSNFLWNFAELCVPWVAESDYFAETWEKSKNIKSNPEYMHIIPLMCFAVLLCCLSRGNGIQLYDILSWFYFSIITSFLI